MSYARATRKPRYQALLVLPFLIIYEIGLWTHALGDQINGADALLQGVLSFLLAFIGVGASRLLISLAVAVFMVVAVLRAWQARGRIRPGYVMRMIAEVVITALVLASLVHFILGGGLPRFFTFQPNAAVAGQLQLGQITTPWAMLVAAAGAGIFEELVFRVLLLGGLYKLWARGGTSLGTDQGAAVKAALASSAAFTLLHVGAVSAPAGLISIFITSLLLSGLYLQRGYAITAAVHIAYDLVLMLGVVA